MSASWDLFAELRSTGRDVVRPGADRSEVASILTELTRRFLEVDDCWLQPPGEFGRLLLEAHADETGISTANVDAGPLSTGGRAGRRTGTGIAVAPVDVDGERHVLVAWQVGVRAWTTRDRRLLRAAADELTHALGQLAGAASPEQHARTRFDEMRSDLLVTLDHELRTPMTILQTGLELLEDLTDGQLDEHTWLLRRLQSSVERLHTLADDVGRIAHGTAEPDTAVAVASSVEEAVRAVVRDLPHEERHVDLQVDLGEHPSEPVGAIEAQDLRIVLQRVLDNAVKFTAPGGSVQIVVGRSDGGVEVVVSDTGIGIADDEHFCLGQAFVRTRETKRLEHQGPGLGLAVVRSILGRWQGRLSLARRPEGGTEARIWLRSAQADA